MIKTLQLQAEIETGIGGRIQKKFQHLPDGQPSVVITKDKNNIFIVSIKSGSKSVEHKIPLTNVAAWVEESSDQ